MLFVVILLQYFLGAKIMNLLSVRIKKVKFYNRVVLSHRAVGYGLLVFLVIREGKILENANILKTKVTTIIRIITYVLFLVIYTILYIMKWSSKGSYTNVFIGVGEREDNGWLKRVYIAGE